MIEDVFKPVVLKVSILTQYVQDFIASPEHKTPETRGTYERALREFVHFFAIDRHFKFRVADVERYREHLRKQKQMKDASVSTYLTALRRLCQYLIALNILEKNPAKRVKGSKRPKKHSRSFLTLDEIDHLFVSIQTNLSQASPSAVLRDTALVRVMLGCACAEIEIININIGDLKKEGRKWTLRVQGKGKSVKDEMVPVPPMTMEAITAYLTTHPMAQDPNAPLFVSYSNRSRNQRMTIRGVRETINHRFRESGLTTNEHRKISPFSLRHTAGILLAESGMTPEMLMQRMRIEWRPTAMIYFEQSGKLHSAERGAGLAHIHVEA